MDVKSTVRKDTEKDVLMQKMQHVETKSCFKKLVAGTKNKGLIKE